MLFGYTLNLEMILGGLLLLALLAVVFRSMEAPGDEAKALPETVIASELDGVLEAGVGQLHEVKHDNKFICHDCNTCMPAQYRNDVNLRFENLENVRRIRALRGDPFPTYKLN